MAKAKKNYPIEKAKSLLHEFGITRPPTPIERIARKLGVKLRFSPLDNELSGMILKKDGTCIIGVNSLHHPNRQRFTIAHEIGHFLLHGERISDVVHVDKQFNILRRDSLAAQGIDIIEIEANAFAAELLMPKEFIEEYLQENSSFDSLDEEGINKLAQKFKVSPQAIQLRLGQL